MIFTLPLISHTVALLTLAAGPKAVDKPTAFEWRQDQDIQSSARPIYVMAYRLDEAKEFEKVRQSLAEMNKSEFLALKAPKFIVRPIDDKWYVVCYFGSKSEAELKEKDQAAKGFEQLVNAKKPVRLFDLQPNVRDLLAKPFITTGYAPNENTYVGASCQIMAEIKIGDKKTQETELLNNSAQEVNKLWKEILDKPVPNNRKATEEELNQILPQAMLVMEYSEVHPLVIDPNYKVGENSKISKVLQAATRIYHEACEERIALIYELYDSMFSRLLKASGITNTDAWVNKAIERRKKMNEIMQLPASAEVPEIGKTSFNVSISFNVTRDGKSIRQGIGFHIFRKTPASDGATKELIKNQSSG